MKHIEFVVSDHKLKATLFFPKNLQKKNPSILFIHGWTSARDRSYQYAEALAKLGYISFLFDMQGHGESEGDINTATTKEFLDDVLAAYDYFMKVEGVDTENVGVVGSSFGGYLGILLSEKRNVKRLALRVPADYPNDAFDKSKMVTSGGDNPVVIAWRAKPKDVHGTYALDALSKFTGDMLIIESEKDIVVPHQSIQNYINVIPDRDRLTHVVMKNAPHSAPAGPFRNIVEHTLVDWFRKWV